MIAKYTAEELRQYRQTFMVMMELYPAIKHCGFYYWFRKNGMPLDNLEDAKEWYEQRVALEAEEDQLQAELEVMDVEYRTAVKEAWNEHVTACTDKEEAPLTFNQFAMKLFGLIMSTPECKAARGSREMLADEMGAFACCTRQNIDIAVREAVKKVQRKIPRTYRGELDKV
jgi:hypothetical protein